MIKKLTLLQSLYAFNGISILPSISHLIVSMVYRDTHMMQDLGIFPCAVKMITVLSLSVTVGTQCHQLHP